MATVSIIFEDAGPASDGGKGGRVDIRVVSDPPFDGNELYSGDESGLTRAQIFAIRTAKKLSSDPGARPAGQAVIVHKDGVPLAPFPTKETP